MGSALKAIQQRLKNRDRKLAKPASAAPAPLTQRLNPEKLGLRNPQQYIPAIRTDTIEAPNGGRLNVQIIHDRFVSMDLAKATEYINLPIFKGERDISDLQVQYLFDCMRQRQYLWSDLHIATILCDSVTYKGNGQHSSWATAFMCDLDPTFASPPVVRETAYRVTNEDQMRALYSMFDRNKVRSDGHINKVLLVNKAVTDGVHNNSINKLISGIKLWRWPSRAVRDRLLPDHIAAYIEGQGAPLFRLVALFLQDKCKDSHIVWRQGVVAAMFATFEKSAKAAAEFWEPVASGLNLTSKFDPRHKLREWLSRAVTGVTTKTSARVIVSPEEMLTACLGQWNKWRKDEKTQIVNTLSERPRLA